MTPKYSVARQVSDASSTLSQLVGAKQTLLITKGWSYRTMLAVLLIGILLGACLEHYIGIWLALFGGPIALRDSVLLATGVLPDTNVRAS